MICAIDIKTITKRMVGKSICLSAEHRKCLAPLTWLQTLRAQWGPERLREWLELERAEPYRDDPRRGGLRHRRTRLYEWGSCFMNEGVIVCDNGLMGREIFTVNLQQIDLIPLLQSYLSEDSLIKKSYIVIILRVLSTFCRLNLKGKK